MKKSLQGTFLIILSIAFITIVTSCNKKADVQLPIPAPVINDVISGLTSSTVTVGGRLGVSIVVTEVGICYSATNKTPTTTAGISIPDTVGARWENKLTGLTPNTTYYVRAYASNDTGIGYSDVLTFTTPATNAVPTGTVTTFAGSLSGASGYVEGTGTAALFDGPQSISFNAATGLLYVSDSFNNTIRTIKTGGATASFTNPGIGYLNGTLPTALFYGPKSISFDTQGNGYVADLGNNVIRKITPAGVVTTLAGNTIPGYVDGAGTVAEFYNPTATVADAAGNVYVADRSNNLIRKITPAGVVSVLTGYIAQSGFPQSTVPGYLDGTSATSVFNYPVGLAMDASGNIYVADQKNNAIRKVATTGDVTTYAGGLNFPALIGSPTSLVLDAQGNMFIADNNGRILELTKSKVLYVLAGAKASGNLNGVGALARFSGPQSLTLDASGNLYVADFNNNAIRKITIAVQ